MIAVLRKRWCVHAARLPYDGSAHEATRQYRSVLGGGMPWCWTSNSGSAETHNLLTRVFPRAPKATRPLTSADLK